MEHSIKKLTTPSCPNCKMHMYETAYDDLVFVCINATCNWIVGPDTRVRDYFEYLKKKAVQP